MANTKSGVWKTISAVVITAFLTLAIAWVTMASTMASNVVSRDEMNNTLVEYVREDALEPFKEEVLRSLRDIKVEIRLLRQAQ